MFALIEQSRKKSREI